MFDWFGHHVNSWTSMFTKIKIYGKIEKEYSMRWCWLNITAEFAIISKLIASAYFAPSACFIRLNFSFLTLISFVDQLQKFVEHIFFCHIFVKRSYMLWIKPISFCWGYILSGRVIFWGWRQLNQFLRQLKNTCFCSWWKIEIWVN